MRISKHQLLGNLPLFLILLVSSVTRVVAAFVATGESGGDFYNYLLIAKSFLGGGSLFIEKRLPVYALLLIPGHLIGHPLGYARGLGIVLALLTLYFLYKLLLELQFPKIVALTSLILLSFQPTFFLFSIRPLSHTLLDLEVILALYLFYKLVKSIKNSQNLVFPGFGAQLTVFSLVLGLSAMTRHEGFLLAGVLMLCLVIYVGFNFWNRRFKNVPIKKLISTVCYLLSPFTLIVMPWFVSNFQRFGNPFYTQYETDTGLNVARTWQELAVNFNSMKLIFLNMWGSSNIENYKLQIILITATLFWLLLRSNLVKQRLVLVVGLETLLIYFVLWGVRTPWDFIGSLTISLMLVGTFFVVAKLKLLSLPLFLVLGTQFIFLVLVQPWWRHSQHIFFFSATALVLGIHSVFSHYGRGVLITVLGLILLPVLFFLGGANVDAFRGYVIGGESNFTLTKAASFASSVAGTSKILVSTNFTDKYVDEASLIQYYLGSRLTYSADDRPGFVLDYQDNSASYGLTGVSTLPLGKWANSSGWAKVYAIKH